MIRENRIPVMMNAEELEALEQWRFANRCASRSKAVRRLVNIGIHASAALSAKDAEISMLRRRAVSNAQERNAAEREVERLRRALKEARGMVAHWGAYASEYFQDKHDLPGDLGELDAALAEGSDA